MTVLPALRNDLVDAASRRRQRAPRRRAAIAGVILATAVAGTATAAAVITGSIGGPPTHPMPRISAEERDGMVRTAAPRVLGRLHFVGSKGAVELVGYRMKGYRGHGSLLCLDLANPDGTKSGGCSPDLSTQPNGLIGTSLGPDGGSVAVGATHKPVASISIQYSLRGATHRATAQLVRVPASLAEPLQTEPFSYYAAPIPRGAHHLTAIASQNSAQRSR